MEAAIAQFRTLISNIKRPLLEGIVDETHIGTQLGVLSNVLEQYIRFKKIDPNNPVAKELIAQFQLNGGFKHLDFNPGSREQFLYYLDTDVRMYPYTISPSATNIHISHGTLPNK
jgi:hypothetical protein